MLLVTNALLIPVAADGPDVVPEGWMLVGDDGRIDSTGSGTPPAVDAEILDVAGAFVAPGFVSSHSHLFTSGTRGLGVDQTLYGWCDSMLGFSNHASADQMYWSTLHGSIDFLANGVTTAFDFTNPRLPWEQMIEGKRVGVGEVRVLEYVTRQADAKADAGIRYINAVGMDVVSGTGEEIFERLGAAVAHDDAADQSFRLGSAVFGAVQWSPRRDTAELELEAMRRFGIINQAHFLETREESCSAASSPGTSRPGCSGPTSSSATSSRPPRRSSTGLPRLAPGCPGSPPRTGASRAASPTCRGCAPRA